MDMKSNSPDKQLNLDKRYIRMAQIWAENSYCQRRKVGALIVKDKMIISDGYNGTPAGFENCCEDETGHTFPFVLHAEANAITKVARSNNSSDGATLYVTSSPCIECAKLIIQSGIKRVVFSEYYRLQDGIDLLMTKHRKPRDNKTKYHLHWVTVKNRKIEKNDTEQPCQMESRQPSIDPSLHPIAEIQNTRTRLIIYPHRL